MSDSDHDPIAALRVPSSSEREAVHRSDESRWPVHPDPMAEYDTLGRKQLQPLNAITGLIRAIPVQAFAMFGQVVPIGRYAALTGRVKIRCPCGEMVELDDYEAGECPCCDIAYLNLGYEVRACRLSRSSGD